VNIGCSLRLCRQAPYVKEARLGEVNILNSSVRISDANTDMLEIVLAAGVAQLDGSVSDLKGQLSPGAQVVLIPDNRESHGTV
jgi:hypothetical protein